MILSFRNEEYRGHLSQRGGLACGTRKSNEKAPENCPRTAVDHLDAGIAVLYLAGLRKLAC